MLIIFCRPKTSPARAPPSRGASRSTPALVPAGTKVKPSKAFFSVNQRLHGSSSVHKEEASHSEDGDDDVSQLRIDVDQTVQRLERKLDDITIISPPVRGGASGAAGFGNYDDDILPGPAENMGSGNSAHYMYLHFTLEPVQVFYHS